MSAKIVYKKTCGVSCSIVDPESYPFAREAFDDELPIKDEFWSDVGSGELVIDVGALWGSYTIPALVQGARVIAFEPVELARQIIRQSAEASRCADRLDLRPEALFDGSPYPPELAEEVFGVRYPTGGTPSMTTLDEALAAAPAGWIGLPARIKIDAEGAELGILMGGLGFIGGRRPKLLIEDHTDVYEFCRTHRTREQIVKLLRAMGYTVIERRYEFADRSFRDIIHAV